MPKHRLHREERCAWLFFQVRFWDEKFPAHKYISNRSAQERGAPLRWGTQCALCNERGDSERGLSSPGNILTLSHLAILQPRESLTQSMAPSSRAVSLPSLLCAAFCLPPLGYLACFVCVPLCPSSLDYSLLPAASREDRWFFVQCSTLELTGTTRVSVFLLADCGFRTLLMRAAAKLLCLSLQCPPPHAFVERRRCFGRPHAQKNGRLSAAYVQEYDKIKISLFIIIKYL